MPELVQRGQKPLERGCYDAFATAATYTLGWGKAPAARKIQEKLVGQSWWKPGAGKARQVAVPTAPRAALETAMEKLELWTPSTSLAAMAKRMVSDAVEARMPATRQVLSLVDAECERQTREEDDSCEQAATEVGAFSLVREEAGKRKTADRAGPCRDGRGNERGAGAGRDESAADDEHGVTFSGK